MYPARSSTRKDNFVYAQGCLRKDGAHPLVIENFRVQYQKLLRRETGLISRAQIRPVAELPDLGAFAGLAAAGREALERCVVIKLNGGLGTSMGLERAKSLIAVKDGLSFLDIIVRQVLQMRRALNIPLPLLLMNSFNTRDDTLAALEPYPELAQGQGGVPVAFRQNRVPKLLRKDLRPARCEADPSLEWCPPGHGDIYTSLHTTGLLDLLLARGIEYAFVSNADNLGALLDLSILGAMHTRKIPFLMEVTTRTEADRKGGHIGRAPDGRLLLRELAQCPEEELEEFQDINLFRYFNTNNLWLNLAALKARLVAGGGVLDLPLIINYKTVDPKDLESDAVIQLETAMGAAIALFEGACAVRVPRERFAPVKTTNDLLVLWSDIYQLNADMQLVNVTGRPPPPVILDPVFYRRIGDFQARFAHGAPGLTACRSLQITGDIFFGRAVTLAGDVHLVNRSEQPVRLPDGWQYAGHGEARDLQDL